MPIAIVVLVLAAGWRVLTLHSPELSNFSPVMALAFCAGAYGRNRWMWLAPFAALALSDVYIDHYYATVYHYEWSAQGSLLRILCFAAAGVIGLSIAKRRNWINLFGGALLGSMVFYFITNTASWASDLGYARTLGGWWQAMTVGHPEYYPTLFFFRNTIASDLLFTGLFAAAVEFAAFRRGEPSLFGLKQVRG